MNFADLFASKPKKHPLAEGAEVATLNAIRGGACVREGIMHPSLSLRENPRVQSSAPSAPQLVPLDRPFVDGQRYQEAGATECYTRLDLYIADDCGPWIRRHGVLMRAPEGLPAVVPKAA